ncbi:uncharacterized protein C4orf54 homolog [Polyodon spathula]|uniref:uncharacterized protein C4orf54 homolog n=1 Tax=Polyodon spathula TaxID=7913 RepID=UPI001B7E3BF7|nr:uncharacterized protein C4orf54 homolog [Polyodon spathula]
MRDKPHLCVVSTDQYLNNSRSVSRHCVKDPAVSGRDRSGIGKERQAQLFLSSKNRNIPEHSSTQLPAREEQPGMTGCNDLACHFSSTTQEEKLWDTKKQNSTAHKRSTFSETSRRGGADCTSETSSMGSEFDEADNEVKCLTDLAFKSLSYPQDDYLAIYNSSYYRSSTNMSQPSTEGSCGVNAWPADTDFHGSGINDADLPENKDPVDRFEMGNFECVDVVLENQDQLNTSCSKRTVPKRQIQLKRQEGNVFPSRGLTDCQPTSRPFERRAQDIFIRQHSTPAVLQDESNKPAEVLDENSKKQKLHKSVSLDETSSRAKIASCLIKNVLSKKMQHEHKLQLVRGDVQDADPLSPQSPSSVCDNEFKYSNTSSHGNLYYSSEVTSDGSFASEHLQMDSLMQRKFDSSKANKVSKLIKHNGLNAKTQEKPICKYGFQSYEKSLTRDFDTAIITSAQGSKSRIGIPWSNRKLYGDNNYVNDVAKPIACTNCEKKLGDSESYVAKDSLESAPAEPASVWSAHESPKNDEHEAKTDETQHFIRNVFTSKTPEITLRPRNRIEKKNHTFSIARLLSPNTEGKSSAKQNSEPLFKSTATTCMDQEQSEQLSQLEVKDSNLKNKPNAPMHKVRDVRKLVKHTYNLSFKASAIISPEPANQEQTLQPQTYPLLVECKAISREDSMLDPTSPLPLLIECKAISRQDSMLDPTSPLPECKAINKQDSMLDPTSPPPECKAINRQDSMLDPTSLPPECKAISRQDSMLDPTSPLPECKAVNRQDSMLDKSQQLIVEKQVLKSTTQKVLPCQNREYASAAVPKTYDFEESVYNSITKKDLKEQYIIPPNHNLSDTSGNSQIYSESVQPMDVYCEADQLDKGSETSPPNREGDKPNPQCLPSKNSHSVSMIIKEKGFQADIGLFDSEPIHSPPKHVNTLEVPLQTCTSEDKVKKENSVQTSNSLSRNMNRASATELNSETPKASDIIVKELQPQVKHHQSTKDFELKWQIPGCADHNITSDDPPEYEEKKSSRQCVRTQVSPGQAHLENPTRSFKQCSSDGYISPPQQTSPLLPPSGVPPAKVQDLSEALLSKSQPTKRPQVQAINSEPLNYVAIPPQLQQRSPLNPSSFQPESLANLNFQPQQSFDDKPFQKETSPDKLCGSPSYRQLASPKMFQEARPQFMCSPLGFSSPYATERGNEDLSFAENIANTSMPYFQYHQSRRKVLYDPETGKYFYIEVPVQPQRKMLYDPETGQYVEVLIPQQCLAQSSVYQPPTSPFSSFMNPGMYGSHYMPYAGLPMPPQATSPLRHPDLHNQNLPQNNLQLSGPANQALKPALQNAQLAEPSCLESIYYSPTGLAASTNPTQPSFYQKVPSSSPGKNASVALPIKQHLAHVASFTEG